MSTSRVWRRVLGVEHTVVEGVGLEAHERFGEVLVADVRPYRRQQNRCGVCGRRGSRYDAGDGPRRWRGMDLGTVVVFLRAEAPRVRCREHGVVVAAVPWARHGSGFCRDFEDTVAWSAVHTSKTAVAALWRIDWDTVGRVICRVQADRSAGADPLDGLVRIGIDEISYRKGHRYLVVVVDHDTGRLVWAAPGRTRATVEAFFAQLGPERAARLRVVTADAADWIRDPVQRLASHAELCLDPFHVVAWATDALDVVRRDVWNDARRSGDPTAAKALKRMRWVLLRNWDDLRPRQRERLAVLADTHRRLYRAWTLKEVLREVFHLPIRDALAQLDDWLAWASRSRLAPFVELARRIRRHRPAIEAALELGASNGRVESMNAKIRLIHRRAFGFGRPEAMIAMAMLALGPNPPVLPGR